ncbi:MAG: hypothetical protein ACLQVI_21580, partial [Polyangiaceae bacterium]
MSTGLASQTARDGILRRLQLNDDAGECLRERVVDLPREAISLFDHRGVARIARELRQLDCERDLVRKSPTK